MSAFGCPMILNCRPSKHSFSPVPLADVVPRVSIAEQPLRWPYFEFANAHSGRRQRCQLEYGLIARQSQLYSRLARQVQKSDTHRYEFPFHQFQHDRFALQQEQLQLQQKMYDDDFDYQMAKCELSGACLALQTMCHRHMVQ